MVTSAVGPLLSRPQRGNPDTNTHRIMSATTTTTAATRSRRVSVGIIGCGEVTQVIHLPTLVSLSELFEVRLLCDVSEAALAHCSLRLPHAHRTTRAAADVCAARDIDVVLVASSDEFHATHVVAALDAGKHVFVEKPVALSLRDVDAIEAARARSGTVVMVGYMRRYAAVLRDAIDEVGGAGEVLYARVRGVFSVVPQAPRRAEAEGEQTSSRRIRCSSASLVPSRYSRRTSPRRQLRSARRARRSRSRRH